LVDNNPEAINTMRRRLRVYGPEVQRSAEVLEAGVEEPQPLLF
jgi:hypothetical protein